MKKFVTLLFIAVLCFAYAEVRSQIYCLDLKTDMLIGETFTIKVVGRTAAVKVDWGTGTTTSHTVSTSWSPLVLTTISKALTVDKPTIKVYGTFYALYVDGQKLTSITFQGGTTAFGYLKRLDAQNNFLTSLVFPSDMGLSTSQFATLNISNNNFDVCGIEGVYSSILDRSAPGINSGQIYSTGNGPTLEGVGNEAQNDAVKLHSKISLATARNWKILDAELVYADALANPIQESPTAEGCVSTNVERTLSNNSIASYYNKSKSILNIKIKQQLSGNLMVYDAMGKLCYSEPLRNNEAVINTTPFGKGIYIVKVSDYIQKILLN